ncbi:MAG: hypothetical protein AAGC60_12415 [Acidobacteriota bacterium]
MDKLWSKTEITYLKRHHESSSVDDLAQRFHTDADTVRAKMQELGLVAGPGGSGVDDEALAAFGEGVEHLHAQTWQKAADSFRIAVDEAESRHLRDRASQYLAICEQRLADPAELEDRYLAAVLAKNRGDLDGAQSAADEVGDPSADERAAYLQASIHALRGDEDEALAALGTAIELEPKNRVHAYHDPDFEALRGRDEFRSLLGSAQA